MKKYGFMNLFLAAFMVVGGFTYSTLAQCGGSMNVTNTCTGEIAGANVSTGTRNSFFGRAAGFNVTTGGSNSAFGTQAGFNMIGSTRNSFFGSNAGVMTTGNYNSLFGAQAGRFMTTGAFNSWFGDNSGEANITGNYNSGLGRGADVSMDGLSFATAIGAGAEVSASNTVQLGRDGFDTVRIGDLGEVDMPIFPFDAGIPTEPNFTLLCLNSDNEISDCNFLFTGPAMAAREVAGEQNKTIETQRREILKQQGEIQALRNAVCELNPKSAVCRK